MIRLVALLSFYDERPEDLVLYVASLQKAGIEHLVAVDGAYALYPDAKGASPPQQRAVLETACVESGIDLTIHVPSGPWQHNEPGKRNALFALAAAVTGPGDWFFVLDTDELLQDIPEDFRHRLEGSEYDTALVTICDTQALAANRPSWPAYFRQRRLFRAQQIFLTHSHATYYSLDGRVLGLDPPENDATLDLADLTVWHAPQRRGQARQTAKAAYYKARERSGAELGSCACGAPATEKIETGWRWSNGGPVADIRELCGRCARRAKRRNHRDLERMGVRPDSVVVAHRYGKAPA